MKWLVKICDLTFECFDFCVTAVADCYEYCDRKFLGWVSRVGCVFSGHDWWFPTNSLVVRSNDPFHVILDYRVCKRCCREEGDGVQLPPCSVVLKSRPTLPIVPIVVPELEPVVARVRVKKYRSIDDE